MAQHNRPIQVRLATPADAALIADLSRQTFLETFAAHNDPVNMDLFMNSQFTRTALMQEVGQPGYIFFLAYDGVNAVGYAKMREGENRPELRGLASIEIARIYAVRSAIGKGVGKALMEKCIEKALQLQKKAIWLGVWEKNDRALTFYKQFGFERFGEHSFILGRDVQTDWLLKKELH